MPTYKITHPDTGQVIRMTGESPPREADIQAAFAAVSTKKQAAPAPQAPEGNWRQTVSQYARPALEMGGMLAGGAIAAPFGGPAAPVTAAAGGALGYAGGAQAADVLDEFLGVQGRQAPQVSQNAILNEMAQAGQDVGAGAAMEMGGQALGKAIPYAAKQIGKVAKPVLGRLSGTGTANVTEAIKAGKTAPLNPFKSGSDFDKAMRGKISGEQIVDNSRKALTGMKTSRGEAYRGQLEKIGESGEKIDLKPIQDNANKVFKKYVRFDKSGNPDWSRSALGKEGSEGVNKMKDLYETVIEWGSKEGDNTPLGVDMLKRQIDDMYAESSNARSIVTQLRKGVKSHLKGSVPGYGEMTKGYEEATKLIKDIESGLMMRKQAMTGRVTADQTLRRITSAMKDNFALRKDLLDALKVEGSGDISAQIAGHNMAPALPHGLAGSAPAMFASGALSWVKPEFLAVVAASSPRVQGEFLRYLVGKPLAGMAGAGPLVGKTAAYMANEGE